MSEPFISIDTNTNSIYRPITAPAYTNITEFNEEPVGIKTTLVLALPFDENTSFTDIAPAMRVDRTIPNKIITNNNSVGISSTIGVQLGRSSAYFDGTNQSLSFTNINMGTGDFTYETWVYPTESGKDNPAFIYTSSLIHIVGLYDTTGGTNAIFGASSRPGAGNYGLYAPDISLNTWHHIAWVRSGSSFKIYVDGVDQPLTNTGIPISGAQTNNVSYVGTTLANEYFQGYLQDLRIYKGYAKYTEDFTPPTRITGGFGAVVSSTTTEGARLQAVFRETGISTDKFSIPPVITKYVDVNAVTANPTGFPYIISPALDDGRTAGDFSTGLSITGVGVTGRCYTLTPEKNTEVVVRMWGAGGGEYATPYLGRGGGGGAAYGRVTLSAGIGYSVFAGGRGTNNSEGVVVSTRGSGGGGAASGILLSSDQSEILIAGAGGGGMGEYGLGRGSGAGGGTTGQDGEGATTGGDGGTQIAGGAGGISGRVGASATDTNGAGGNTGNDYYPGGTSGVPGKYNGGMGEYNAGDIGSPGGGGGHFGGGQGGGDGGAFGSGGGSGYYNPSVVVGIGTTILYTGNGSTPGNDSDPYRGTYGDAAQPGLVYLSLV